jgi:hypothetical protein
MTDTDLTPEPESASIVIAARERVLSQIEVWRKELINLAKSNRLLYFKHSKSSTLEIVREPDQVAEVVHALLAGETRRFYFPPESDEASTDEDGVAGEPANDGARYLFVEDVPGLPAPD